MSREEAISYAHENNIPLSIGKENPYSIDLNLWGRSCECGVLEDPWVEPPEDAFAWTAPIDQTPDGAETIELLFAKWPPYAFKWRCLAVARVNCQIEYLGW